MGGFDKVFGMVQARGIRPELDGLFNTGVRNGSLKQIVNKSVTINCNLHNNIE